MQKKQKKNSLLFNINLVLILIGVFCAIIQLREAFHIHYIVQIIIYILVGAYATFAYETPHGNLLRYLILLFAVSLLFEIKLHTEVAAGITQLILILTGYVAGRLNKLKLNKVLFPIILAGFVATGIISAASASSLSFTLCYSYFSGVIIWLGIGYSYFFRYEGHKQAGEEADK